MKQPLKHALLLPMLLVSAVSTAQAADITVNGTTCTLADANQRRPAKRASAALRWAVPRVRRGMAAVPPSSRQRQAKRMRSWRVLPAVFWKLPLQ